jgi:uncharacterized protein YkwD
VVAWKAVIANMSLFGKGDEMKRWLLAAGFVLLSLIAVPAGEAQAKTYREVAKGLLGNLPGDAQLRGDLEAVIFAEANSYRGRKGVGALKDSDQLRDAARAHAIDMMLNGFVGHKATTGQEFDSRMRAFIGNQLMMPRMAENAARDSQKGDANAGKARRLFQQWVKSRPHRKTLLNSSYSLVSTGVVQRGNKIWAVQIFFSPLPGTNDATGSGGLY